MSRKSQQLERSSARELHIRVRRDVGASRRPRDAMANHREDLRWYQDSLQLTSVPLNPGVRSVRVPFV